MQKGDFLIAKSKIIYQMVGRWGKDIVLGAADDDKDEVLIYAPSELEELISEGYFRKLHNTGIMINKEE